jgi:hypothetical protein
VVAGENLQNPVQVVRMVEVLEVLAVLVSLSHHHAPVDERAQLLPLPLLLP